MIDLAIFHIPGNLNVLADILSRNVIESRFLTGTANLSKKDADKLPPFPDNFLIDSDTLYTFLTNNIYEEQNDSKTTVAPVPEKIEDIYQLFKNTTPEQRYFSAMRAIMQNRDPFLSSDYDHNKKQAQTTASSIIDNEFKDLYLPKKLVTKIRNSLTDNILKIQ